jgi:protein-S-isoprenylcysteine O-methyltransferase Ste14
MLDMEAKETDSYWRTATAVDMLLMLVETVAFVAQVVLCILYYNSRGWHWMLFLGWATFIAAIVLGWRARVDLQTKGDSRDGESWLRTRRVVSTGVYVVIRHPMYLSFIATSLSLVFLSQHWLSAVLGALFIALLYGDMRREERSTEEKLGDEYRTYLARVPRMNAVSGIVRQMRRARLGETVTRRGTYPMHYVAGALLIAQFALMWVVDESVRIQGLDWLAWAVWLCGIGLLTLSMLTLRRKGRVPDGRSCVETAVLVDTGVYGLVRHPLYLGWLLMHAVVPLFKPNALLAVLGIAGIACVVWFTLQEEALLLDKFGDSYRSYMQKVPRYNLLAGGVRCLRARWKERKGTGA